MEVQINKVAGSDIAIVEGPGIMIGDAQGALDLMATLSYQHGCQKAVFNKANITEDFFDLRTGIAGEILQKFTDYQFAVAIYGDFSGYESRALRDFIRECNRGRQFYFAPDQESAIEHLQKL